MTEKKTAWHRIAADAEALAWRDNGIALAEAGGRRVCIARVGGTLWAFAAACPHAGASLSDGWFDAKGRLACPLHKYRFDVCNGRNVSGEGYHLKTYPLRATADGLEVELPEGGPAV